MNSILGTWVQLLVDSLVQAGVQSAVLSPGSRSTPLVLAASAAVGLRCFSLVDERSAAFFALGQARASGRPSALICTSGTAAANYFPAVIEAKLSGVPLVVISADRPPELQYCGAGQTLDQLKLFGAFARFYQLASPSGERDALLALRRIVHAAVAQTLSRRPSPVHFNFPVGKPLEFNPSDPLPELPPFAERGAATRAGRLLPNEQTVRALAAQLASSRRPLVIFGACQGRGAEFLPTVARFLKASDSLFCGEAVGQLRFASAPEIHPRALDAFDWLFSLKSLDAALTPDLILQLGEAPLSAGLQRLLARCGPTVPLVICSEGAETDPIHRSAQVIDCEAEPLLEQLSQCLEEQTERTPKLWQTWLGLNAWVWQNVETALKPFTECQAVATLLKTMPTDSFLAVGNSLAPRHLDRYCRASNRGLVVGAQRGASGIEGPIAAALGAASELDCPTTLLVGDVSFLHDVGSLWAADASRLGGAPLAQPVVLVVLNNEGGRIFEQLPVSENASTPLHLWTTPHQVRFADLAAAYSVKYASARDTHQFQQALAEAYDQAGVTLIEVSVPRSGSTQTDRAVRASLQATVDFQLTHLQSLSAGTETG